MFPNQKCRKTVYTHTTCLGKEETIALLEKLLANPETFTSLLPLSIYFQEENNLSHMPWTRHHKTLNSSVPEEQGISQTAQPGLHSWE